TPGFLVRVARRMSTKARAWPRRWFLAAAGLGPLALASRPTHAAPPDDEPEFEFDEESYGLFAPRTGPELQIDLPQLQYGGDWNPRPGAMRELGQELRLRTRLVPLREPSVVSLDPDELFQTPFLYVAGAGGLPGLVDDERAQSQLRRFVDLGGMFVFDDADGGADFAFGRDVELLSA